MSELGVIIIIPVYRGGNWDPEWFSNLKFSKITNWANQWWSQNLNPGNFTSKSLFLITMLSKM